MKFVIPLFFWFVFLTPVFAGVQCSTIHDPNQCTSTAGCEWHYALDEEDVSYCDFCSALMYNSGGVNSVGCQICAVLNGNTYEWYNGYQPPVSNSIFDSTYANTTGLHNCPWICQNGYFDDVAHTECFYCPTSISGFMSYRASADISHISTCNSCGSDRYIIKKTVIENGEQGYKYYCGTCDLNVTPTETGNGTNVYTCTCPENTNHNSGSFTTNSTYHECVCPNNATWNGTQCVCNDPDETIDLDTITNLYVCRSCSNSHAVLDNGVCKCDIGYYGTTNGLQTSCSKCPTGTITTAIGATYRTDCQMNSSTKFCYGSGNNKTCISLLPSGVTINASTTAPNNANNVAQNIAQ